MANEPMPVTDDVVRVTFETAAAFQSLAPGAPLPWRTGEALEREVELIFDANGRHIATVDEWRSLPADEAVAIAHMIVIATNTCGGFRASLMEAGGIAYAPALVSARGERAREDALIEAVLNWAAGCEGIPAFPNDACLLKAVCTYEGDQTEACPECDGECGEPCAPCTVEQAHAALDRFIANWQRDHGIRAVGDGASDG